MFDGILNLGGLFRSFATIFLYGGWVLVVIAIIRVLFELYMNEITTQWARSQQFICLQIKVPRDNLVSTLAVEAVFGQMHALHTSISTAQKYVEGKGQLWYSLEIISMGGKISFIVRVPIKSRDLVEAAFYAQYPEAEISEIADYMENIEYDPETSDINIWGCDYKLVEDDVIPIRTYREFEHPTAEEKIIDPLASLFEALNKVQPHEFYGIQMIIQPLADGEWKPRGEKKVKQMTGEVVAKDPSIGESVAGALDSFGSFSFKNFFFGAPKKAETADKQKNNWQNMTEIQKERVTLVERKIGKPGYKTKLRHLYIAPKSKFDGSRKSIIIGAYRPLGSVMTNQFKPDTKFTWTSIEYKISPSLEKPYIEWEEKRRKVAIFNAYKGRDYYYGMPMFILNTEELATLFHFPIATQTVAASIERTESKKSQAPVNLPVVDS